MLAKLNNSAKIARSQIEFVDIAGLIKGASKGEGRNSDIHHQSNHQTLGLGNQFLANIREVSVILHVVRCYEDESIIHVENSIDPIRDIETIELELMLSDLEALERTKKVVLIKKRQLNDFRRKRLKTKLMHYFEQKSLKKQSQVV